MPMAELFPPGTTLRSSKEALDVEIFGHAPGALNGEDAYVCTLIRDGEDAGEDLVPVSRAHDEAEFARVEPPASPASPASPTSVPPRSTPRGEPPKGRGDDAFHPGARLCDAKTKPEEVNFVVEIVSYDPRKDRYRCVFRDGKGKKLDEDVVSGRRLHDPSAFRQIGAGQKRSDDPTIDANRPPTDP